MCVASVCCAVHELDDAKRHREEEDDTEDGRVRISTIHKAKARALVAQRLVVAIVIHRASA